MGMQTILLAGDRGASRSVRGRSKAFLELAGKPMVVHVLETLLHTPDVGEIFVVGDAIRLEKVIAEHGCLRLAAASGCPVHIVPQRSSLYENVWYSFLRTLPPGEPDENHAVLVVPTDLPLVIPEEISAFIHRALDADADYVVGLSEEHVLLPYGPSDDAPGIKMAYFNLREGRFRQNNLSYVRPLRMGNRHYVQEMYEMRYQKQFWNAVALAWRILIREFRNLWILPYYLVIHLAGVLNRRGYRRAADRVRRGVSLRTVERGIGALLRTRFKTVETEFGGAALDVDNDEDLAVAEKMLGVWKAQQARIARSG